MGDATLSRALDSALISSSVKNMLDTLKVFSKYIPPDLPGLVAMGIERDRVSMYLYMDLGDILYLVARALAVTCFLVRIVSMISNRISFFI